VIKNKMSAFAGCVVLALGLAACGSSGSSNSSSSETTSSSSSSSSSASAASKTATTPPTGSGTISGAGSTFAAPVYEQWASSQSSLTVNYQAVGSGAGLTAIESKVVDFGASDPPLKAEEEEAIAKNGSPAVQIPMFLGAITVSYNLPGVKSGLKLDGKTLGDIFLGKIKTWDDAEIKALNPGVSLPSTPITVIHRSDSSGTTAGFTGFLSAVDPEFKSKVGEGKEVPWPGGTGAKGNAGVAGAVKQTEGAVGYVEQAYALENGFTYASVKNRAGAYVMPNLASTTAAAQGVSIPQNLGLKISNPGGAGSYPITSQTFIVVNKDLCKAGTPGGEEAAKDVAKFIEYGLGAGQEILKEADYAKLPAAILAKSKAALASLECDGSPLAG
jgi:phosphate transport system substrate-binding protein